MPDRVARANFEHDIIERVVTLETQMEHYISAVDNLTTAVNALTAVLNKGRGALWVMIALTASAGAIGGLLTWGAAHIKW